jgi:AcrR family transcriptional regulator
LSRSLNFNDVKGRAYQAVYNRENRTHIQCKGYAGTSMYDLTEATGLTKGSIYGNFENKDDVALAGFRPQLQPNSRIP